MCDVVDKPSGRSDAVEKKMQVAADPDAPQSVKEGARCSIEISESGTSPDLNICLHHITIIMG